MVEPTDDLDTAMKMIMDDLRTHKWTVFVETGPGKFSAHASLDYFKYYRSWWKPDFLYRGENGFGCEL